MPSTGGMQRAQELFEQAVERTPEERASFLERACGEDAALRREVASLLAAFDEAHTDDLLPPIFREAASLVGQQIGPYRVVREIGQGGMGAVYLAEREDVQKTVALKLVREGRLASPEHVQRFLYERRVLARLEHPHIAHLLDAGVTDQRIPFFAMEFVEGRPIDEYCDAHRLTVGERLGLFQQVCEALQYAHRNLIVHRDLKPSNILVIEEGHVKVLDFGIAKLLEEDEAGEPVLTRTGMRLMTPAYAAPEQVRGEPVTTATDVYALGVLLYERADGGSGPAR